jgi:hypothetical protein
VIEIAGRRVVAECKGGPLIKRGSQEYRILKEALDKPCSGMARRRTS